MCKKVWCMCEVVVLLIKPIILFFVDLVVAIASLELRPTIKNVNIFMRRTKLYFGSTWIKVRSSVGSDVELRMRRTNQLNQISSKFSSERGQIFITIQIFNLLVWWSSHVKIDVFAPETIFRRSIRLKQTDRTCWTIQTQAQFRRRASAVPN